MTGTTSQSKSYSSVKANQLATWWPISTPVRLAMRSRNYETMQSFRCGLRWCFSFDIRNGGTLFEHLQHEEWCIIRRSTVLTSLVLGSTRVYIPYIPISMKCRSEVMSKDHRKEEHQYTLYSKANSIIIFHLRPKTAFPKPPHPPSPPPSTLIHQPLSPRRTKPLPSSLRTNSPPSPI